VSRRAIVTILYEDQQVPRKEFGLHKLVKACVFDRVNGARHQVEGLLWDARPMKGAASVLRGCHDDFEGIARWGQPVFAVFDEDRIREALGLRRRATEREVLAAIQASCPKPELLRIVLLKRNLESVIEAAAECDPSLDRAQVERALRYKKPIDRDLVLASVSREIFRPARDCVLEKVPSLAQLVEALCRVIKRR
jgi:hypothetical protein